MCNTGDWACSTHNKIEPTFQNIVNLNCELACSPADCSKFSGGARSIIGGGGARIHIIMRVHRL